MERLLEHLIRYMLYEDIGYGDITTELLVPEDQYSDAVIIAKSDTVIAGLIFVEDVFRFLQTDITFRSYMSDGDYVISGTEIASLRGKTRTLLSGERVALNILQRLSGIATLTREYVEAVKDTPAVVVDTRKTTPMFRLFEKYAVRVGGGRNHRFGLFDGILIKDNHISSAGGVKRALEKVKNNVPHLMKVEIEVTNIEEFREAIKAGADVVLLDNMSVEDVKRAV
ncbi:MAG: carboxylating nicotinate-nucleotide diphosphorylase, partial [Nitrospirae bacterium]